MKITLTTFVLLLVLSVNGQTSNASISKASFFQSIDLSQVFLYIPNIESTPSISDPYAQLSKEAINKKYIQEIKNNIPHLRSQSKQHDTTVYRLLLKIFPYWYGTEWDYNGYTHQPRNGQVACGYFVSTTLRDAGFNLNRYDLAKCYSHKIVTTVCDSARNFSNLADVETFIAARPNDIYIVGLDNHVGYFVKETGGIFFVHSSYVEPVAVVKEPIRTAEALVYSERFVVGSLLGNPNILSKWKSNTKIVVTR